MDTPHTHQQLSRFQDSSKVVFALAMIYLSMLRIAVRIRARLVPSRALGTAA